MLTHDEQVKKGKKNKNKGKKFEVTVREDLEKDGWLVFKNSNDVQKIDTENGQTIKFKQTTGHWNPFTKQIMMNSGGFPDLLVFKQIDNNWLVKFYECKVGKYLSPEEKIKCEWIEKNLHIGVDVAYQEEEINPKTNRLHQVVKYRRWFEDERSKKE